MGFQEVGGASKYYKYNECKPGQILVEGWFTGIQNGKFGNQYHFVTPSGESVVLNKAGQLDHVFTKVCEVDDFVRVTYDGKKILEKGDFKGKEVNQFKVERDPSRKGRNNQPQPMEAVEMGEEVVDDVVL